MLSLSVEFVLDMNNQLIVVCYQLIKSLLEVFKYFFFIVQSHLSYYFTNLDKVFSFGQTPV